MKRITIPVNTNLLDFCPFPFIGVTWFGAFYHQDPTVLWLFSRTRAILPLPIKSMVRWSNISEVETITIHNMTTWSFPHPSSISKTTLSRVAPIPAFRSIKTFAPGPCIFSRQISWKVNTRRPMPLFSRPLPPLFFYLRELHPAPLKHVLLACLTAWIYIYTDWTFVLLSI